MANNDILKGRLGRWNVAHRLEKSALLNSVCFVAGISIFFFGYDQGLMGGVNTARNYVELMGFGHWDEEGQIVVIDEPVKQGFIVSLQASSMGGFGTQGDRCCVAFSNFGFDPSLCEKRAGLTLSRV
jgi:hypothetical protein